jgi:predicted dehydrogenase
LDVLWQKVPGARVVAVADAAAEGRDLAGKRLEVSSLYDDYRQMLARERLDVVTVAPRWLDQREATITAAAAAGCHIFCEKPLAIDAASADRMLAACRSAKVKIAVAHTQRAASGVAELRARLVDGRLGKILRMNARGKEDHRAGGEDLAVLGCHLLDLMTLLAGSPKWVSADVLQSERSVVLTDARQASEPIGPIAGDCISVSYGFERGVHGTFESKSAARESGGGKRHALEIICTKGVALLFAETAEQFWLPEPAIDPHKPQSWEQLGSPQWLSMKAAERFAWCKVQIATDLLQAIAEDREPLSSGATASTAVEMVQAAYAAHLSGGRVSMPLENRQHPLS